MRIALPSKGELEEPTLRFFESAGLTVERASARRYTGTVSGLPDATVLFQRAADIVSKVEEGSADLGLTGYDTVAEASREGSSVVMVHDALGFSHCDLVLAVPENWIDTSSMADLADLSVEFRDQQREMRIATKYPKLVRSFLFERGINHFSLVSSSGAMEIAPTMGYADVIADLTSSGTTLRENHLKTINGGTILSSQACLIGNRESLANPDVLAQTRILLELIEARMRAREFSSVTANVKGADFDTVADRIRSEPDLAGIEGPTIARVAAPTSSEGAEWFSVTVVVPSARVVEAVRHFREIGGSGITVFPPRYVFESECRMYEELLRRL